MGCSVPFVTTDGLSTEYPGVIVRFCSGNTQKHIAQAVLVQFDDGMTVWLLHRELQLIVRPRLSVRRVTPIPGGKYKLEFNLPEGVHSCSTPLSPNTMDDSNGLLLVLLPTKSRETTQEVIDRTVEGFTEQTDLRSLTPPGTPWFTRLPPVQQK